MSEKALFVEIYSHDPAKETGLVALLPSYGVISLLARTYTPDGGRDAWDTWNSTISMGMDKGAIPLRDRQHFLPVMDHNTDLDDVFVAIGDVWEWLKTCRSLYQEPSAAALWAKIRPAAAGKTPAWLLKHQPGNSVRGPAPDSGKAAAYTEGYTRLSEIAKGMQNRSGKRPTVKELSQELERIYPNTSASVWRKDFIRTNRY